MAVSGCGKAGDLRYKAIGSFEILVGDFPPAEGPAKGGSSKSKKPRLVLLISRTASRPTSGPLIQLES